MRGILFAALFGISCFASDVLVPGDPPLTRTAVANENSRLEWLAGTPLAPQQRETMEKNWIDTWHWKSPEELQKQDTRLTSFAAPTDRISRDTFAYAEPSRITQSNGAIRGSGCEKGNYSVTGNIILFGMQPEYRDVRKPMLNDAQRWRSERAQ